MRKLSCFARSFILVCLPLVSLTLALAFRPVLDGHGASGLMAADPKSPGPGTMSPDGFAVVELFTSEGCSSCPPADEAMARIMRDYKYHVYVLCYHVDYWNNLGWKDRFSNAGYTSIQQQYARLFNLNSIYTPQAVVNGKIQMVGSRENDLRAAINSELKNAQYKELNANAVLKDGKVLVSIRSQEAGGNSLYAVLLQSEASSDVRSGENGGHKLSHVNIVRDLQLIRAGGGTVTLTLPKDMDAKNGKVLVFVRDDKTFHISGASQIAIQ